jgi:hypothetical protein
MAKLQPKDKVEWRAGATPSTSHLRSGVVKEVLPDGIALVKTKVEGVSVLEEIRAARLTKVEEPKKAPKKKAKKTVAKKGKKKRSRRKKKKAAAKKEE